MSDAENPIIEPLPRMTAAKIILAWGFFLFFFPCAVRFIKQSFGVVIKENALLAFALELFFPVFCTLAIIVFAFRKADCRFGFRKVHIGGLLAIGIGWFFSIYGNLLITMNWECLLRRLQWDFAARQDILILAQKSSEKAFLLLFFYTCVIIPLIEEIVFRRALYSLLLPLGKVAAVIFCAAIFSAMHFFLLGAPGLFFFGIVLQCLLLLTKNLWVPVSVHGLFNMTAMLVTHFLVE